MSRLLRKPLFVLTALLAGLALAGCGSSHTRVTTGTYAGESGANAPYLYVGPLIYQVQLSRQLNPYNSEDEAYLAGLTPAQQKLEPGEEWFAVFMQVYNQTSEPHTASDDLTVSDTQQNLYTPLVPNYVNEFAYRGGTVPPNNQLPLPGTVAEQGPAQGLVLLYKIKLASLDNRPLKIRIVAPEDATQTAEAELDV